MNAEYPARYRDEHSGEETTIRNNGRIERKTIMQSQTNGEQAWREKRAAWLKAAMQRPTMFIGEATTAHLFAVREPLRLVWIAQVFRRPLSATILLSPTQYIVRCYTGPLLRPIQNMFSFEDVPILGEGWREPAERIKNEYVHRILNDLPRLQGWRDRFGCSTGPRLDSPMYPLVLARRFAISYRVDKGMWCQTFDRGWPQSKPCLIATPSSVGLLAAAELDTQWFTGLPFGEKAVEALAAMPSVTVEWHDKDDLLPNGMFSIENVRDWI